jgi:hypothetical protein
MVKERGEPHLPISACCLTYPLQLWWHANPALSPEHGSLVRIALGQASSLHRFRRRRRSSPLRGLTGTFVRRLRRYYTPVRLPVFVHHWLSSLDFPTRPAVPYATGKHGISRFSREVFLCMLRFSDRAGSPCLLPYRCIGCCLPLTETTSAPRIRMISRLNSPPARAPVYASHPPARATVHDSGSV